MTLRYTAVATAGTGRQGWVRNEAGTLELELSVPEAIGGQGGEGSNPEELFAAGYSACFASAVRSVAAREQLDARDSRVTAKVSLVAGADRTFHLEVELVGSFPDLPEKAGMALMQGAHQICPYSQAIRGNVDVTLSVSP